MNFVQNAPNQEGLYLYENPHGRFLLLVVLKDPETGAYVAHMVNDRAEPPMQSQPVGLMTGRWSGPLWEPPV